MKARYGIILILLATACIGSAIAAPIFKKDSFRKKDAKVWLDYVAGISGMASNTVPGEPVIFSKVSGPGWLEVSESGGLSGMPENADLGTNTFLLEVSDGMGATDQATMKIPVVTHPKYPPFSWDTVPVYIHFGKKPADLTSNEVAFVAGISDFVCLEKGHGYIPFGSTEAGISNDAARLKIANPDIKVLYYWNSFLNYQLYDACDEVDLHPDWIFRTNGVPVYKKGTLEQYNILNEDFRIWWADEAGKAASERHCDGIFADALLQPHRTKWLPFWAPATTNDLFEAQTNQLTRAADDLGEDGLILYNGGRATDGSSTVKGLEYLPYADGLIIEHFAAFSSTNPASIALDLQTLSNVGKSGKICILKGWPEPGFTWNNDEKMQEPYDDLALEARNKIAFSLACYLVAAEPYTWFAYSWGYRENHGSLVDYPEFRLPLGRPLGDAVINGWVYTRSFEHLDVEVNIETRETSFSGLGAHYFNEWLNALGLPPTNTAARLAEYALGTNGFPTIGSPTSGTFQGLEFVYPRRRDARARRLEYVMEATTNLVSGTWGTNNFTEIGAAALDSSFEMVTNRINAAEPAGFVRLKLLVEE